MRETAASNFFGNKANSLPDGLEFGMEFQRHRSCIILSSGFGFFMFLSCSRFKSLGQIFFGPW